jgi:hypothetical protein
VKRDAKTKGPDVWNKGKTITQHGVEVDGEAYRSCWEAFNALFNPHNSNAVRATLRSRCINFRKQLKEANDGKLAYANPDDGRIYTFSLLSLDEAPPRNHKLAAPVE